MLERQRQVADQRFDLPHYDRMLDAIEREFQVYNYHFLTASNKIVKNFKIENAGGLVVRVNKTTDSMLFHTEESGEENVLLKTTLDDTIEVTLANDSTNYVELEVFKITSGSEAVALWDAIANSQQGEEFSQISDTCLKLDARLVSNTVAFTGDSNKIPLAIVTTAGGAITDINDTPRTDEFFFHLQQDWDFGSPRSDLTITTLKEAWDAVTTAMKEMKGTTNWYDAQGISTLDLLERVNYILCDGGKIDWEVAGVETLRWSADLKITVPNRAFNYTVSAQSVVNIADGDIVYVTLPDVGVAPGGALAVQKTTDSTYALDSSNTRNYILAYRSGTKIYFGNGWQSVELESGEQNELGDGITTAILIAGGLVDENDSTPPYTSTFIITPGTSWTNAISQLDAAVNDLFDLVTGNVYSESVLVPLGGYTTGTQITLPSAQTYEVGLNSLEVYYDGRFMDIGDDYLEIDDGGGVGTKIELVYGLAENVKVKFRIQIGGSTSPTTITNVIGVENESVLIESALSKINFTGTGVSAVQTGAGEVNVIIPGLAGGATSLPPILNRQNNSGNPMPAGALVFLTASDTIQMTDADVVAEGGAIGITQAPIADTAFGDIYVLGWVIPGVLDGLGFSPGDIIYMSTTTGQLTNVAPVSPDVVYKIGYATNLVTGEAKDLIMQAERQVN